MIFLFFTSSIGLLEAGLAPLKDFSIVDYSNVGNFLSITPCTENVLSFAIFFMEGLSKSLHVFVGISIFSNQVSYANNNFIHPKFAWPV